MKALSKAQVKAINTCKDTIAKERDKLRAIIEDAESVADSCDQAVESLESAVDYFSQYL